MPHETVLGVAGKFFFMGLMGDFFVWLITVRACLELVGGFFKEKSRFLPLVSPGHVRSRCQGRAELTWLLLFPSVAGGKGPTSSHSCSGFLRCGVGRSCPARAGVSRVVVGAVGRAQPELLNVCREV